MIMVFYDLKKCNKPIIFFPSSNEIIHAKIFQSFFKIPILQVTHPEFYSSLRRNFQRMPYVLFCFCLLVTKIEC
jgi:hypothetical protein